jgi:hypothetical protein
MAAMPASPDWHEIALEGERARDWLKYAGYQAWVCAQATYTPSILTDTEKKRQRRADDRRGLVSDSASW